MFASRSRRPLEVTLPPLLRHALGELLSAVLRPLPVAATPEVSDEALEQIVSRAFFRPGFLFLQMSLRFVSIICVHCTTSNTMRSVFR